ncbi:MAG: UDP-N-acetylglucosamine 1-carboxyvinyltransferase [Desulfitobacteriaceae bacterium]|nr:UDP-N-acetylglucosamine 1-carboxyvinyltransferase [Desulfitobacteriaceae bacterium]MDD4751735.1 UDP-N-acetylglucosamine 1-carboxyvinyltransferase [Desulfitobacteriaceae bacterium]
MAKLVINGGIPLEGSVKISGAKNAALAVIAASLLAEGETVLENIPQINDVVILTEILQSLGASVCWKDRETLSITVPDDVHCVANYREVKRLRASNLLLGPLVARRRKAQISLPGGCQIGSRPMDLHLKGLAKLGCTIGVEHGFIKACCSRLEGNRIYLDFPSVGATENIMMAAAVAEGKTIIENAAKEPEIVDLASFLNSMGGKIQGAGTDRIKITGVKTLRAAKYAIIPDRIETGTFLAAVTITGGNVRVENVIPPHLKPIIAKLQEAGAWIKEEDSCLHIVGPERIKSIDIKTLPFPGFPTDMQSQMMALLALAYGTGVIVENVFENRLLVANELNRMGARIKVEGHTAIVQGVPFLNGVSVKAPDLRSGAALILAGLAARGTTEIYNLDVIDRGYLNVEEKLNRLGADIKRID